MVPLIMIGKGFFTTIKYILFMQKIEILSRNFTGEMSLHTDERLAIELDISKTRNVRVCKVCIHTCMYKSPKVSYVKKTFPQSLHLIRDRDSPEARAFLFTCFTLFSCLARE